MASTSGAMRRAGRSPSSTWVDWVWGSHFIQSHSAAVSSERTSAISRSLGLWRVASWRTKLVARARRCMGRPMTLICPSADRLSVMGCPRSGRSAR